MKTAVKETSSVKKRKTSTNACTERSGKDRGIQHIADEEIALRAYQLWQERGCTHGYHREDWLQSEQELKERWD